MTFIENSWQIFDFHWSDRSGLRVSSEKLNQNIDHCWKIYIFLKTGLMGSIYSLFCNIKKNITDEFD